MQHLGDGHRSLCWLPDDVLATMEPVISFDKGGEPHAHDIVPEDAGTPRPFGTQPRPVAPPKRKRATPAAGALAGEIIEADEAALAAASDPDTVTAPDPGGGRFAGAVLPAEPIAEVGDGRQALDPLVPPAGAAAPPPLDRPADADDLQLIAGIGPAIERQLNELGVLTLAQIAAWTDAERDYIDRQLNSAVASIASNGFARRRCWWPAARPNISACSASRRADGSPFERVLDTAFKTSFELLSKTLNFHGKTRT